VTTGRIDTSCTNGRSPSSPVLSSFSPAFLALLPVKNPWASRAARLSCRERHSARHRGGAHHDGTGGPLARRHVLAAAPPPGGATAARRHPAHEQLLGRTLQLGAARLRDGPRRAGQPPPRHPPPPRPPPRRHADLHS